MAKENHTIYHSFFDKAMKESDKTDTDAGAHIGKGAHTIASYRRHASLPNIADAYRLSQFVGKPLQKVWGDLQDA